MSFPARRCRVPRLLPGSFQKVASSLHRSFAIYSSWGYCECRSRDLYQRAAPLESAGPEQRQNVASRSGLIALEVTQIDQIVARESVRNPSNVLEVQLIF